MKKKKPPKSATTKKRPPPRVRVGDRVRFRVGTREIVAEVVEDRGYIGVNGRHAVAVSFVGDDGEVEKLDWPADELTVDAHRATA